MKNKHRTCENCVHLSKYKEGGLTIHKRTDKNKHYFVCEVSDGRMESPHGRCKRWKAIPYNRNKTKGEAGKYLDEIEKDMDDEYIEMQETERRLGM